MKQDKPSIGGLLGQLIDDGRAYATAEVEVAKERTLAQIASYRQAAIWAGLAIVAGTALLIGSAVALVLVLANLLGPYLGAFVALLLLAAMTAFLGWRAMKALEKTRG